MTRVRPHPEPTSLHYPQAAQELKEYNNMRFMTLLCCRTSMFVVVAITTTFAPWPGPVPAEEKSRKRPATEAKPQRKVLEPLVKKTPIPNYNSPVPAQVYGRDRCVQGKRHRERKMSRSRTATRWSKRIRRATTRSSPVGTRSSSTSRGLQGTMFEAIGTNRSRIVSISSYSPRRTTKTTTSSCM